ncbi:MAG: hypothetical protein IH571_00045 [Acholeplasmataceae bacterium]|nr:hypothetical protein [Acholeplasmataceae bacterium]
MLGKDIWKTDSLHLKTINEGIAFGKVVHFDEKESLNELSSTEINQLIVELESIKDEYIIQSRKIFYRYLDHPAHFLYHYDFATTFSDLEHFNKMFKKNIQKKKMTIEEAFKRAYEDELVVDPLEIKKNHPDYHNFITIRKDYIKRISTYLERVLLKKKLSQIEMDSILILNHFKIEYFYQLPQNIKGVVLKHRSKNKDVERLLSTAYELPFFQTDFKLEEGSDIILDGFNNIGIINPSNEDVDRYKKMSNKYLLDIHEPSAFKRSERKIKIFAPVVDGRHIEIISNDNWYDGIAPIRTEYLFMSKGMLPTISEQVAFLKEIIERMDGKEIYVRLPDFRPEKPTPYLGKLITDIINYFYNSKIFDEHLKALAYASQYGKIHIVVPMIDDDKDISFWKEIIKSAFEEAGASVPRVGIMMETDSAFTHFEYFIGMDFAILGLNNLIEDMDVGYDRNDIIPKNDFFRLFGDMLRDVHQNLRYNKIDHLIMGNVLNQPDILDRILKMGFKNICIPASHIKMLAPTIHSFIDNSGKFVGVAAKREGKKNNDKDKLKKNQYQTKETNNNQVIEEGDNKEKEEKEQEEQKLKAKEAYGQRAYELNEKRKKTEIEKPAKGKKHNTLYKNNKK